MKRWSAVVWLVVAGCGASTGLRRDDAGRDVVDVVDAQPTQARGAFERCAVGDSCAGGTSCLPAGITATDAPARLCTLGCAGGASCPAMGTHSTFPVACATANADAGAGQCYEICEDDRNCGPGTRCTVRLGLAIQLCLPVGVAP